MSAAIGPGDWVEVVRTNGDGRVSVGAVLCVLALAPMGDCDWCHGYTLGAHLVGVARRPEWMDDAFCLCCELRPIYRPSESLFHDLMQPIPADMEDA